MTLSDLDTLIAERDDAMDPRAKKLIEIWPRVVESYSGDDYVVKIRDKEVRYDLKRVTLSGNRVSRVALPKTRRRRRVADVFAERKPAGQLPLHGRRVRVQARGRRPDADVRGRGRSETAPTSAFKFLIPRLRRPSACRRRSTV